MSEEKAEQKALDVALSYDTPTNKFSSLQWMKILFMSCTLAPIKFCSFVFCLFASSVCMKIALIGLTPSSGVKLNCIRKIWEYLSRFWGRASLFCLGVHWVVDVHKEDMEVGGLPVAKRDIHDSPITICNHVNGLECFYLFSRYAPSFICAIEHSKIPFVGPVIVLLDCILVNRKDPDSREKTIRAVQERAATLDRRRQLMVFPEGTCANQLALFRFGKGAFLAGLPVRMMGVKWKYTSFNPCWTTPFGPGIGLTLWMLCCNFHNSFHLVQGPVYYPTQNEVEDPYLYSNNVQKEMAKLLGCVPSPATYSCYVKASREAKVKKNPTAKKDE